MAGIRKTRTGTVIRDKNDKTIVVAYSWSQRHRVYKRSRRRITKFVAHDEHNEASIGDRVIIEEHRPLSKTKRWRLRRIVERVDVVDPDDAPIEIDQQDVAIGEGR
jgi:small subunit ribosomal protein S17